MSCTPPEFAENRRLIGLTSRLFGIVSLAAVLVGAILVAFARVPHTLVGSLVLLVSLPVVTTVWFLPVTTRVEDGLLSVKIGPVRLWRIACREVTSVRLAFLDNNQRWFGSPTHRVLMQSGQDSGALIGATGLEILAGRQRKLLGSFRALELARAIEACGGAALTREP